MTLQIADQPILGAVQVALKTLLGVAESINGQAKNASRSEALFQEMTSAGDLLLDALRLEHEYGKMAALSAEDGAVSRWKASRSNVEQMAANYADAVTNWRRSLDQDRQILGNPTGESDESLGSAKVPNGASGNAFDMYNRIRHLPYDLLLRVNRVLVIEKGELLEEVRQLKAAVNIYRELAATVQRDKVA